MTELEALIAGLTDGQRAQLCPTCVEQTRTTRYCAKFACVCGHETCYAFLSYIPRRDHLANVVQLGAKAVA